MIGTRLMWWGYEHTGGSIQVKRYFESRDIAEARESVFVRSVYGPFLASGRDEAVIIMGEHLGRHLRRHNK